MKRVLFARVPGGILVVAFAIVTASPALAASGELDPTFGEDGIVQTDFGSNTRDGAGSLVLRSDGTIVVGASTEPPAFAALRYTSTGQLDPSFGVAGKAVVRPPMGGSGASIVEQPDGKLVIGGFAYVPQGDGIVAALAAVRLLPDGQPDFTFGVDGMAVAEFPAYAHAADIALGPDGEVVVAGSISGDVRGTSMAVARFTPEGQPDLTFSGDGKRVVLVGEAYSTLSDVSVLGDGRVVLAGWGIRSNQSDFALVRLNADGSLDPTFSEDGKAFVHIAGSDLAYGLFVYPGGRILAVGIANNEGSDVNYADFALARLLPDGTPDPTFGTRGRVRTHLTESDRLEGVTVQPDGMVAVVGEIAGDTGSTMVVARYSRTGVLDPAFGDGGVATTIVGVSSYAAGVGVQSDGRIVISGGTSLTSTDRDVVVGRYLA